MRPAQSCFIKELGEPARALSQATLSSHGENSWQQLLRFPPSAFSTLQLLQSRFPAPAGRSAQSPAEALVPPKPRYHTPSTNTAALAGDDSAEQDNLLPRFSCSEQHICSFPPVTRVPPQPAARGALAASLCASALPLARIQPTGDFSSPLLSRLSDWTEKSTAEAPEFLRPPESCNLSAVLLPPHRQLRALQRLGPGEAGVPGDPPNLCAGKAGVPGDPPPTSEPLCL